MLLITVPPLRRVTFFKRQKGNPKGLLLRSALAGSGSFAPGLIRAQRLRFASLHLLPLCLAAPDGRCAPTPGSIPPLSLPTSPVDQDQKHSSLRSVLSGAASPRAAALLGFSVGASLLAKAALKPTDFSMPAPDPTVGAAEGCDLLIWLLHLFLLWLWLLNRLLIFCPFGRLRYGIDPGVGAQRPYDAVVHSGRRCSEANRSRCARIGPVTKVPRAPASGSYAGAKPFAYFLLGRYSGV